MLIAGDELGNTLPPGKPAVRFSSGGWKSARLIIFVEMAEQFAFYGISSNLITYLTGPLRKSTAAAAANINAWSGTVSFLPHLWGFLADSFLGRFRTIIIASSLYILGLGLLSFSAITPQSTDSNTVQVTLFFISLYLIAVGQGGYKPCIKVFGADQFDGNDIKESKAKSSFFNWVMFGSCVSILTTRLISNYIQENLSWSLGFGILLYMGLAPHPFRKHNTYSLNKDRSNRSKTAQQAIKARTHTLKPSPLPSARLGSIQAERQQVSSATLTAKGTYGSAHLVIKYGPIRTSSTSGQRPVKD